MFTYEEFIADLKGQLEYQLDGGTSYRIETAKLALQVAKKVNNVELLLERKTSRELTEQLLTEFDDERKLDVAEFLFHSARYLFRKKNMTDEMKSYLKEMKKKNPNITFINKKTDK